MGEERVGTVVIRCPKTGKVVAVGFGAVCDTFHASANAMVATARECILR